MAKPAAGATLDLTHALCPDHCWPILDSSDPPTHMGKSAAPAAPSPSVTSGSSLIVAGGTYGRSVRHGADTDHLYLTSSAADSDAIAGLSGGFTMLIAYHKTDATVRQSSVIGINGSLNDASNFYFIAPYTDGNIYWRYGGSTNGVNSLDISASGVTFGDDLWAVSTGSRGMEVWQNGVVLGSNAANPSRANNPGFTFGWPAGTPTWSDLADVAFIMTWNRQLSAAEIMSLSADPWQMFIVPSPPTYVVQEYPVVTAGLQSLVADPPFGFVTDPTCPGIGLDRYVQVIYLNSALETRNLSVFDTIAVAEYTAIGVRNIERLALVLFDTSVVTEVAGISFDNINLRPVENIAVTEDVTIRRPLMKRVSAVDTVHVAEAVVFEFHPDHRMLKVFDTIHVEDVWLGPLQIVAFDAVRVREFVNTVSPVLAISVYDVIHVDERPLFPFPGGIAPTIPNLTADYTDFWLFGQAPDPIHS